MKHLKTREAELEEISDIVLLEHFENSVKDKHYHPYGSKLNESGFSYEELYMEILDRIQYHE